MRRKKSQVADWATGTVINLGRVAEGASVGERGEGGKKTLWSEDRIEP